MTTSVQITETKFPKTRHDGPARVQFVIQEVAYTDTGRAWPQVIEVVECPPRSAAWLRGSLANKYSGRVVTTLDLSPLVPSLF